MIRAALLSSCLVLLAGCLLAPREPHPAHRAECERQGWTPGTQGYLRCIRAVEGREFLELGRTGRGPFDR